MFTRSLPSDHPPSALPKEDTRKARPVFISVQLLL